MRHNDNGVMNMSRLNDYLMSLLADRHVSSAQGVDYLLGLYADGIFHERLCVIPRYLVARDDQSEDANQKRRMNTRMSSLRQIIEHVFADHKNIFQLFKSENYFRLFYTGEHVMKMVFSSFFLLNCFYSLNGTRSLYFGMEPCTLEQYIPLDEDLEEAPLVDLGTVYEYQYPTVENE
jgi:hypothetical protein